MAQACSSCGDSISFLQRILSPNNSRCKNCKNKYQLALKLFKDSFVKYTQNGILTNKEWNSLGYIVWQYKLSWVDAGTCIRDEAISFLERALAIVAADGIITEDEFRQINELCERLSFLPDVSSSISARLKYLKTISDIRLGRLPVYRSSILLDSSEICHMEVSAGYLKKTARKIDLIQGRLIATNRSLNFLSSQGGWNIQLKNIMRVVPLVGHIGLELSVKKGAGEYQVQDPLYVESIIATLAKMAKRQLLIPQEETTRHIPQSVRLIVWQRDQGKCVQCGSMSYLEYDHIIPHSKGGASTENNVQLLCRRCNLSKGDRI